MNLQTTKLKGISVELTAHEETIEDRVVRLLMASVAVEEAADAPKKAPIQVAIVIDRSGSMSGEKLAITKEAVAHFIRSLDPEDRVAVVTYDDSVEVVCGLSAPSEDLARIVERIHSGGSTNLYGGWLTGAKIVGRGGRVILLSDGLANVGRYTRGDELAYHARKSYTEFGVTTTTIGVGRDYDESLMAHMAHHGGGAHYFAHAATAIRDAFSQERFSTEAIMFSQVSLRVGGKTEQLGHFWGGETKRRVFEVDALEKLEASIRYTVKATGEVVTESLEVPRGFGYSEEVRLERLLGQASEAEAEMLGVVDPASAEKMQLKLRSIYLRLLEHPSSDEPLVKATSDRLRASMERLESLKRNYREEDATMHRKRSLQSSHNLRERAKAYSSFDDEVDAVRMMAMSPSMTTDPRMLHVDPRAFDLAPLSDWKRWEALPVEVHHNVIVVAMEDPRRGFVLKEIERHTRRHIKPVFAGISAAEIVDLLEACPR